MTGQRVVEGTGREAGGLGDGGVVAKQKERRFMVETEELDDDGEVDGSVADRG
jgi:hypothetical protein